MYSLPSQEFSNYWLTAFDGNNASRYPNKDGKWMMFFPMSQIDAKWAEACQLYYSGRLTGVNSMKVSTAKQNPFPERLHGPNEGIIIFYCGPCEDKASVMNYGRNILSLIPYHSTFYYKSDLPHLINHNKIYRHMYSLNSNDSFSHSQDFGFGASIQKSKSFNIQPKIQSSYQPNFYDDLNLNSSSNLDYFYNNNNHVHDSGFNSLFNSGTNFQGFNDFYSNGTFNYSGLDFSGLGFY